MPRFCTICSSNESNRVLIATGLANGEKLTELAKRTALSADAIRRHRKHAKPVATDDLERQLTLWASRLESLWSQASADGSIRSQLDAVKSALSLLERRREMEAERVERDQREHDAMARAATLQDFDKIVALGEKLRGDEFSELDFSKTCESCGRPGVPVPAN